MSRFCDDIFPVWIHLCLLENYSCQIDCKVKIELRYLKCTVLNQPTEFTGEGLWLWLLAVGCWHFNGTSMAIQWHNKKWIGASIHIGRDIKCLPYADFFYFLCSVVNVSLKRLWSAIEVLLKCRWSAIEVPLKCQQPTANSHSHRPSPANSPIIHSRLVQKRTF